MISVIVPIYKVEEYLSDCIESIMKQTYRDIEIILVNDGSPDKCPEICEYYAKKDKRIKIVHKENGGRVSARNAGMECSSGEYIAFIDGDDWVDAGFLEKILPYISGEKPVDMVAFGCIEEYPNYTVTKRNEVREGLYCDGELKELQKKMFITDNFFGWTILPHLWNKIIRKTILERYIANVPKEVCYGEDAACIYPCVLAVESMAVLEIAPYHYRQHEGSIVKQAGELGRVNFIGLYQVLRDAFKDNQLLQEQLKYYMFFALMMKAYSTFSNRMSLFPFEKVNLGNRILVYGAGGFGKVVESYVRNSKELELAGWADRNAAYYRSCGLDVIFPDEITQKQFDYLVIAIMDENLAMVIRDKLVEMGVKQHKIDFIQKAVLGKQELPHWLDGEL